MSMIEQAFRELYPGREFNYQARLKYSGKFSPYNANIKLHSNQLQINLSRTWKGVDTQILSGLVQDLLMKVFGDKRLTLNVQLYNTFIKSLHMSISKENVDPMLKRSFDRVNEQFFSGTIEMPNLIWGVFSRRKLASYNFHTDTISVSRLFQEHGTELLDYVMYHELLHKVMKFRVSESGHSYHTLDFRRAERAYPNSIELEKRIRNLPYQPKQKRFFSWFG